LVGADVKLAAGNAYAWSDTPQPGTAVRYLLEDIDLNGKRTIGAPIGLSHGRAPLTSQDAALLTRLGFREAQLEGRFFSAQVDRSAPPVHVEAAELSEQPSPEVSAQSSPPFPLAGRSAVKISVNREGWYRIALPDLIKAGLDPTADVRNLQLFVDGHEV